MARAPKLILEQADQSPLDFAVESRDRASIAMVEQAVRGKKCDLAFQPVVLASDPARHLFHEGLIRLFDPTGRIIPAAQFIHSVEDIELGRQIDLAALSKALHALARIDGLALSINTSARSLVYPPWQDRLRQMLKRRPGIGPRLIVEVPEVSVLQIPELAGHAIETLRKLGVRFVLDDFGAGASSLRHLRDFRFEFLKLDGQFTKGISRDPANQSLCEGLISLGYHLGARTIAARVEDAEDMLWLQKAGVDAMQGFFFAAPTLHPEWRTGENAAAPDKPAKNLAAAQKIR